MSHTHALQKPAQSFFTGNRLLESLSPALRKHFISCCNPVELIFGEPLCEAQQPMRYAYFPLTGFISLLTQLDDHQPLEMGLIGNEGMLGASLGLGVDNAAMRALVQGTGQALRISAADLRRELAAAPELKQQLDRYLFVIMEQLAKTAACIHFHEVEPRLARWLLMTHDRTHADQLHLTQEFLADMLGVRRSSITVAAGVLQDKKLIHYTRGEIVILDRIGLEKMSCACYRILKQDYQFIFG